MYPNGGERIPLNSNQKIRWDSKLINSPKISIHYSLGRDDNWIPLAENIDNSGCYSWNVNLPISKQAKVKIIDSINYDSGIISGNFCVYQPIEQDEFKKLTRTETEVLEKEVNKIKKLIIKPTIDKYKKTSQWLEGEDKAKNFIKKQHSLFAPFLICIVAAAFDFWVSNLTVDFIAQSAYWVDSDILRTILACFLAILDLSAAFLASEYIKDPENPIVAVIRRKKARIFLWCLFSVKLILFIFYLVSLNVTFSFDVIIYPILLAIIYLGFHFFGIGVYILWIPILWSLHKLFDKKISMYNNNINNHYITIEKLINYCGKKIKFSVIDYLIYKELPIDSKYCFFDTANCSLISEVEKN